MEVGPVRVVVTKLFAVAIILLSVGMVRAKEATDVRSYLLAPGDRITVTVFGQAELSGDFLIDAAGEIQMPLIGAVRVGRSTLEESRQRLAERLADGFVKNPTVSVRVSEFRPIYVLGEVRSPGSYPFRFGLTGLSAIALAGGMGLPDLRPGGAMADLVSAEERLKVLTWTRLGLLVRLARIEAERTGKSSFEAPEAPDKASDIDISLLLNEEKEQLQIALQAHAQTIALLQSQRPKIQSEIETTEKQIQVETNQLNLVKTKLVEFDALAKRGLGRSITELDLQRQAADREGMISRLKGDLARLDSKLGDLDIRAQEAENSRQTRVMNELREAKLKLREIDAFLPAAKEVLELRQQQTGGTATGEGVGRSYRIVLTRGGVRQPSLNSAEEDFALQPGDIIEVRRLKLDVRQMAAPSSLMDKPSALRAAK
jgi:polysaccharide biosynthesis/export protein